MPERIGCLCLSMTLLMGLLFAGCGDDGGPLPVLIAFGTYPLGESCELTVQGDENIKYSPSGMLDINHPFFEGEPYFILGAQVHNYMNDPTANEGGSKYDVLLATASCSRTTRRPWRSRVWTTPRIRLDSFPAPRPTKIQAGPSSLARSFRRKWAVFC